jgi:hypothetical protein
MRAFGKKAQPVSVSQLHVTATISRTPITADDILHKPSTIRAATCSLRLCERTGAKSLTAFFLFFRSYPLVLHPPTLLLDWYTAGCLLYSVDQLRF